eukprot:g50465.t1
MNRQLNLSTRKSEITNSPTTVDATGSGKINCMSSLVRSALGATVMLGGLSAGLADDMCDDLCMEKLRPLQEFWNTGKAPEQKSGNLAQEAGVTDPPATGPADLQLQCIRNLLDKPEPTDEPFDFSLVMSATPDFCETKDGKVVPVDQNGQCGPEDTPLRTQSYLWGMAQAANGNLFYGTGPPVPCLVGLALGGGFETDNVLCKVTAIKPPEMWKVEVVQTGGGSNSSGTKKAKAASKTTVEKVKTRLDNQLTGSDLLRLKGTIGIRSAGSKDDVVFFGGPTVSGKVSLFAFDTKGVFLGSATMNEWNDIRRFTFGKKAKALYFGVGRRNNTGGVYQWTGSRANPFQFGLVGTVGEVGDIAAEVAFTTDSTGATRLIVTTWPVASFGGAFNGEISGLFLSPPCNLLVPDSPVAFAKKWNYGSYDPDQLTAQTVFLGQTVDFQGWTYFGTLQLPLLPFLFRLDQIGFGGNNVAVNLLQAALSTIRPTVLFRGRNWDTTPEIEVLYGDCRLPVLRCPVQPDDDPCITTFEPAGAFPGILPGADGDFIINPVPLWGRSGFGNVWNVYTWSVATVKRADKNYVLDDETCEAEEALLLGTFDDSTILLDIFGDILDNAIIDIFVNLFVPIDFRPRPGADLYVLTDSATEPEYINLRGLDNEYNYGIRNMLASCLEDGKVWIGTANPFNKNPMGGYELYHLDWAASNKKCKSCKAKASKTAKKTAKNAKKASNSPKNAKKDSDSTANNGKSGGKESGTVGSDSYRIGSSSENFQQATREKPLVVAVSVAVVFSVAAVALLVGVACRTVYNRKRQQASAGNAQLQAATSTSA